MIDVETSQTKRYLWIAKSCLMKEGSLHKTNQAMDAYALNLNTLEDGKIDEQRWMSVWTTVLLQEHEGEVWVSIDSTSIARPEAETSEDSRDDLRPQFAACQQAHQRWLTVLDRDALALHAE